MKLVYTTVLHEKSRMLTKSIVANDLNMLKRIVKSLLAFGIVSFGQMKVNSTYLAPMGRLWYSEQNKKSSIQNVQYRLLNMAEGV